MPTLQCLALLLGAALWRMRSRPPRPASDLAAPPCHWPHRPPAPAEQRHLQQLYRRCQTPDDLDKALKLTRLNYLARGELQQHKPFSHKTSQILIHVSTWVVAELRKLWCCCPQRMRSQGHAVTWYQKGISFFLDGLLLVVLLLLAIRHAGMHAALVCTGSQHPPPDLCRGERKGPAMHPVAGMPAPAARLTDPCLLPVCSKR